MYEHQKLSPIEYQFKLLFHDAKNHMNTSQKVIKPQKGTYVCHFHHFYILSSHQSRKIFSFELNSKCSSLKIHWIKCVYGRLSCLCVCVYFWKVYRMQFFVHQIWKLNKLLKLMKRIWKRMDDSLAFTALTKFLFHKMQSVYI